MKFWLTIAITKDVTLKNLKYLFFFAILDRWQQTCLDRSSIPHGGVCQMSWLLQAGPRGDSRPGWRTVSPLSRGEGEECYTKECNTKECFKGILSKYFQRILEWLKKSYIYRLAPEKLRIINYSYRILIIWYKELWKKNLKKSFKKLNDLIFHEEIGQGHHPSQGQVTPATWAAW